MSGDYLSIVGEDDFFGVPISQFQELMGDYEDPYWSPEYTIYGESPYEPLSSLPAGADSGPYTPISNPPELGSPLDGFEPYLEDNQVEEMSFFLFNTPPADTVSPADLTPTTPRSPDTIADMSPTTPNTPDTDGSRASTNPTTPGSPDPENYEPVQMPTGDWKCAFPRCPKGYRRRCDVNKHCKTHTKPFACSSCGQKSSSKRDKERHELSHKSEHPKCPHPSCTSSTSRKDNMRDHIKRKHKDMDPKDPIIDELYSKRPRIQ